MVKNEWVLRVHMYIQSLSPREQLSVGGGSVVSPDMSS